VLPFFFRTMTPFDGQNIAEKIVRYHEETKHHYERYARSAGYMDWENQVLYLEAEAYGFRGTGIGCFFDDAVHEVLGIEGHQYQSLYHFTVGKPIEDPRLTTYPPYSRLKGR
jgi:hypothetical protein